MGLFGFFVKIGAAVVIYDWWTTHRRREHGDLNSPWWQHNHHRGYIQPSSTSTDVTTTDPYQAEFRNCWRGLAERFHRRRAEWQSRMATYNPQTEIRELPNGRYSLEIEVPGIRKEDLLVSVVDEDKGVVLKGVTVSEKDVNGTERRREVDARVVFPRNADLGNVKAKLEDGVLKVLTEKKAFEGRKIVVE
ncbi:hypothetical protein HDV00_005545 [Rhizophlyctis rosea]|nr:hypothetical protein HDV00_005545 [Rhizophlyctis rosea]